MGGETYNTALRWDTATSIPQGTNITSAYVKFVADNSQNNSVTYVSIKGAGSNDTDVIDNYAEWNSIPRTTASVRWAPSAWASGTTYTSPDIKAVIQEAVNNAAFLGAFIIFFDDNGSSSGATRSAYSYEGSSASAPLLEVSYETITTYLWLDFTDRSLATSQYYLSGSDIASITIDVANDTGSGFGAYMGGVITYLGAATPAVTCGPNTYYSQGRWKADIASGASNSKWRIRVASGKTAYNASCSSTTTTEPHAIWITRPTSLGSGIGYYDLGLGFWP